MQFSDDTREALRAKRNENAAADHGGLAFRDAVGESAIKRHGNGYVTEFGHGCAVIVHLAGDKVSIQRNAFCGWGFSC